jgi:transcriptional regulator with XRE-family HTH domain
VKDGIVLGRGFYFDTCADEVKNSKREPGNVVSICRDVLMKGSTGLLRAYTSRVENGHVSPSIGTLEKYAEAFGVPLYTLFYDGPRRTEVDLKLENKRVRHGAAKNQPPQYELFVETVAGLNDRQRALFMHVANKLARRGVAAVHRGKRSAERRARCGV